MKKHPLTLLLAIASGLATSITAHAAIITWGAATNINPAGGAASDLDVTTTGIRVAAFNFAGSQTTLDGVTFDAFPITNGAPSVTLGNFTLATAGVSGLTGSNFAVATAPFSNLSASYQSLAGTVAFPAAGSTPMTLTMTALTVGESYEFQWWSNLSLAAKPGVATGTAGSAVTLDYNTTDFQDGLGQFAIGTFLADSASQVITFSPSPGERPLVNGFQLRQLAPPAVPEPGTALARRARRV